MMNKNEENGGRNYEIVNVVMTARLHTRLPLDHIYNILFGRSDSYLKQMGQLKRLCWRRGGLRSRNRGTIMFFSTGNLILAGARKVKQAFNDVRRVVDVLKMNGFIIPEAWECEVSNIVVKTSFELKRSIEDLAMKLDRCIYEPDQFPGLIYMHNDGDGKFTALLFPNGVSIVAGLKSEKEIPRALECLNSKFNGVEENE